MNLFRFEQLEIWQLAIEYGERCYGITDKFPKKEMYALSDQLRRAAVSISNNIAEGSVGSNENFAKYIRIAIASALETVNILHFAVRVGYIETEIRDDMREEADKLIRKMVSFLKSLNNE